MADYTSEPVSRRTILRALTVGSAAVGLGAVGAPAFGGQSGLDVRELQIRVAGWAADEPRQAYLPITGILDQATHDAVRRFQRAHGLPANGATDPATLDRLAALSKPDGSTLNFEWAQFASPDGGGFAGGTPDEAEVREQVRRLMYKLEALQHKLGGRKVTVTNGFRSNAYQARRRAAAGAMHTHGGTADITVAGLTTYAVYRVAQTCGFSGLGPFTQSWLHCDSRAELATGVHDTAWSWAGGTIQ